MSKEASKVAKKLTLLSTVLIPSVGICETGVSVGFGEAVGSAVVCVGSAVYAASECDVGCGMPCVGLTVPCVGFGLCSVAACDGDTRVVGSVAVLFLFSVGITSVTG